MYADSTLPKTQLMYSRLPKDHLLSSKLCHKPLKSNSQQVHQGSKGNYFID